ncbi:MAG: hypothetical protein IJA17_07335 [Oscillospiraceae bacterium]|nr:hypothetical protein [Oscillospiraceae bacterium]
MYCFDGLYYQLISPGLIFLLGAVFLFYITRNTGKSSNEEGEKKRKALHVISVLAIVFFLFVIGKVGYSIINPTVNTYTGQFDTSYRDSRSAPPLPFTYSLRKKSPRMRGFFV